MKNLTVTRVALQQQQQFRASVCSWQDVSTKRGQGHEAFVADYTQAFLDAEVREGEWLYVQPPEGWTPKASAGQQVCGVEGAQCHARFANS